MQNTFQAQWDISHPNGKSLEQGGTIVTDRSGRLSIQNLGGVEYKEGEFEPNLNLKDPANYSVIGTFHTHPYDADGHPSHEDVSFSSADSQYLMMMPINFSVVQSGKSQFMYLRTKETRSDVGPYDIIVYQNDRTSYLRNKEKMPFDKASRIAAKEAAEKYHFAYYEGSNGTLHRVYP